MQVALGVLDNLGAQIAMPLSDDCVLLKQFYEVRYLPLWPATTFFFIVLLHGRTALIV